LSQLAPLGRLQQISPGFPQGLQISPPPHVVPAAVQT
jgi:hypothetical protein